MLGYAFKRIIRSWPLFVAVIAGVLISSTMFATINIGSNEITRGMVDDVIADVSMDMSIEFPVNPPETSTLDSLTTQIESIAHVQHGEILARWEYTTLAPFEQWELYGPYERWDGYVGIENNSIIYNGITFDSGVRTLGANETFLLSSSSSANEYALHDTVNISFSGGLPPSNITISLEIVGFISASSEAIDLLTGGSPFWSLAVTHNLFILDLDTTVKPVLDFFREEEGQWTPWSASIAIFIDRDTVISTADIEGTLARLSTIEGQLANMVLPSNGRVTNNLALALQSLTTISWLFSLSFLTTALPILFIAVYMGITLSDVSYNLRRRETGLLLTRGFTRGTVLRMFLVEGLIIGLITGIVGILIALVVVPFLVTSGMWTPVSLKSVGWDTILVCLVFTCSVALISVYFSARRASRIPTVEALREYSPIAQPTQYRKYLTWTLLILGGYKIFMWLLGINPSQILTGLNVGFLVMLMFAFWVMFDTLLTPFAVLFFIYGFTKVAVLGSTLIYRVSEKITLRGFGDIGILATRSIQRNPTRTAAVVFLLALVLGYGVQSLTVLASEPDYVIRGVYTDIGSDISAYVLPPVNATTLIPKVEAIAGVESATVELFTTFDTGSFKQVMARAVIAENWSRTAYYEESWFSFVPSAQAFAELANNNRSIIIQPGLARSLAITLGGQIAITIGTNTTMLTVIGFFGPESSSATTQRGIHSFVSIELLKDFNQINSSNARLLVKTIPAANITAVTDALEEHTEVTKVESVAEQLEEYATSPLLNAFGNMMRIGLIFSFILASLGTLIVITFTLKEKQRENALMAARGLSFRQIAAVLVAESTSWVVFAVLIGLFTGIIASLGALQNLTFQDPLLVRSPWIMLTPTVLLQLLAMVVILILCAVVPMLLATRHAQSAVDVLR